MIAFRSLVKAFRELELGYHSRVVVHASLEGLGEVLGGEAAVVGALIGSFETVLMPAFTPQCMVVPPEGPPENGLDYAIGQSINPRAVAFHSDLSIGEPASEIAEHFRLHPQVERSTHPLLSFAARNGKEALQAQSLEDPLAPIAWMAEFDGDILLLGEDHQQNVSLHYAERLAGRKQFLRWALTEAGVEACPSMPGCSEGFHAATPLLRGLARRLQLGPAVIEVIPLRDMINCITAAIREDPRALLCDRTGCPRCAAVRTVVRSKQAK